VTSVVLASILYLCSYTALYVERQDLVCGLSASNVSSCGKVCVQAFWDKECKDEVAPWGDFTTTLEDTAGAHKPLIWPDIVSLGNGTINSIKYFSAITENTTNCKPLLFLFYNQQDQTTEHDLVLMTPGQRPVKCEAISNDTVAYAGVTYLEPLDKSE
jgi:hypothetical protein